MKILKEGKAKKGFEIQIEDWSDNYSFMSYGSTIGAYPVSKQTGNRMFAPTLGETFRLQYDFNNNSQAEEVFDDLMSGKISLKDIEQYLQNNRYKDFV